MNNRGTNGHSVTEALPKYEIVDCEGKTLGPFNSATEAAGIAAALFGQQDPDRTGKGWDIQVIGAG